MVALAERLRLELDSSDRKNLVGSQIIPDKLRNRIGAFWPEIHFSGNGANRPNATTICFDYLESLSG